jgi:hypothetical protein
MRYGTYTCGLATGGVEYGFTFGEAINDEATNTTESCEIGDSEFDIVLGVARGTKEQNEIEAKWAQYEWVAKAIIAASSKLGDEVKVPNELGTKAPLIVINGI